jgi:hypothetical protein
LRGLQDTRGHADPVPATWITQDPCIGYGELTLTHQSLYGAIASHFCVIGVHRGQVIDDRTVDNQIKSMVMPQEGSALLQQKRSWMEFLIAAPNRAGARS